MPKKNKLKDIIKLDSYMRIAIDNNVEKDADGNFLVNFGYLRVSTDRQADEGYGLEVQEKSVLKCCEVEELTNLVLFIDDGYTGTNMDRPALDKIKEYIKNFNDGRSNIRIKSFVVPKIDRLGRTLLGTLQFIQDYIICKADSRNSTINNNKEDIAFFSADEKHLRVEPNNPQSKFLLILFAGLAEFDRDLIVQKLKRGRTARVENGFWPGGGNEPYGYAYNKETGILEIVPEEAEKVREIFRLYIEEKMSPQKIAERLGFKGERIVIQILRRKSLTGKIVYLDKEYDGGHEAIIPMERWKEAQEEIKNRSKHRADSKYLLSGLLRCGECGAKMRYQKWSKTGAPKIVCYSHQKSSKAYLKKSEECPNEAIWAEDVENKVVEELFRLKYLGDAKNKKQNPFVNPIEIMEKERENERKRLSKLYDLYSYGDNTEEDEILAEKIKKIKARIKDLDEQLNNEKKRAETVQKIEKAKEIIRNIHSAWPTMDEKQRQSICRELIEEVVIYSNGVVDVYLKLQSYLHEKQKTDSPDSSK